MTGTPRNRCTWFRRPPTDCFVLRSVCAAVPPIASTTLGLRSSIWRNRYGAQAAISSYCGRRFSGGRHFTTLQMNTRSRGSSIAARIFVSSSPAGPTKILAGTFPDDDRSEEHTSELQSQSNLVCRLLLEKKKKKTTAHSTLMPKDKIERLD